MNMNGTFSRRLTTIPTVSSAAADASRDVKSPSYYQFLESKVRTADVILLDTNCWMKPGFEEFAKDIARFLKNNGKTVTVLQGVLKELRYLTTAGTSAEERQKAGKALAYINELNTEGLVSWKGNPNSSDSGCAAVVKYAAMHLWDQNLFVLTQDARVAHDLRILSEIKSAPIDHPVVVKRLTGRNGRLGDFNEEAPAAAAPAKQTNTGNANDVLRRFGL